MTPAIIATIVGALCSCIGLVFGIIAINAAGKANSAYEMGDYVNGASYHCTAKSMTILAYVLAGVGFLRSFFILLI